MRKIIKTKRNMIDEIDWFEASTQPDARPSISAIVRLVDTDPAAVTRLWPTLTPAECAEVWRVHRGETMNRRFKALLARHGFWILRSGKGSHRIITNGKRRITCSSRAWREGHPEILENLERQIRRMAA